MKKSLFFLLHGLLVIPCAALDLVRDGKAAVTIVSTMPAEPSSDATKGRNA
jgi:hypothetical protein